MVRYLFSILFFTTLANASEKVCENEKYFVEQPFQTAKDMIIVLEQGDGISASGNYSVRFIKKPNEWDSISKWIHVPASTTIIINSISLSKDKCKIPHHEYCLLCFWHNPGSFFQYGGNEYQFIVKGVPESEYSGCKSPSEFYSWVE